VSSNLLFGKFDKLNAVCELPIKSKSRSEEFLDILVVVDRTRLEPSTEKVVQRPGHLVLDFVAQSNQKPEIRGRGAVERTRSVTKAALKLPVPEGTVRCPIERPPTSRFSMISILDAL
jgi:hypothetical protein